MGSCYLQGYLPWTSNKIRGCCRRVSQVSQHSQLWDLSKCVCMSGVPRPLPIPFLPSTGGSHSVEYNSHKFQLSKHNPQKSWSSSCYRDKNSFKSLGEMSEVPTMDVPTQQKHFIFSSFLPCGHRFMAQLGCLRAWLEQSFYSASKFLESEFTVGLCA